MATLATVLAGVAASTWYFGARTDVEPPRRVEERIARTPTSPPVSASVAPRAGRDEALLALREELDSERARRTELSSAVDRLSERVDELVEELEDLRDEAGELPPSQVHRPGITWLDLEVLAGSGLGEAEIEGIRSNYEELEMERLNLGNRSAREGWRQSGRYAREAKKLADRLLTLREELGDESYDWMLYASGRPNRIAVRRVLESSPGWRSGIRNGDVISSYAQESIFTQTDLLNITTRGRVGDLVRVIIWRSGKRETLYIPRGPIGVSVKPHRMRPEPLD